MNTGLKQTDNGVETLTGGIRKLSERHGVSTVEPDQAAVVRELELILASPFFHASKRSQQFLKYVVQYRLDGTKNRSKNACWALCSTTGPRAMPLAMTP